MANGLVALHGAPLRYLHDEQVARYKQRKPHLMKFAPVQELQCSTSASTHESRSMAVTARNGWRAIHGARYRMHREVAADLFEYIEVFYNRSRRHSSLGFMSPTQFMQDWLAA